MIYFLGVFFDSFTTLYGVSFIGLNESNSILAFVFSELGVIEGLIFSKGLVSLFMILFYLTLSNTNLNKNFDKYEIFSSFLVISGIFYLFLGFNNLFLILNYSKVI